MKKNLGFSSFEFYFVISVIGLIMIFGIQRYYKLAEETQQLSFEVLAQNFSASVYSHHARWLLAQQSSNITSQLIIENNIVQFSRQGWPIAVVTEGSSVKPNEIASCLSLWNNFLQNPPAISAGDNSSEVRKYHLATTREGKCRFEFLTPDAGTFFFEYSPESGQVKTQIRPIAKNS
ncbi:hypothetical protein GCM10011613_10150 [Cellvibrio zantedeschiae]|uniref:MSHA biogenesis protein MshF n=1 Tax=Cellvibrio zantedeschiae TaxID=1237077 RepID=A0ABQ3AY86_9GAMM|nr:hypothetical protein [Cellvibrio zantedeschiae]GGY67906.1 hypothetical protein GCM10011613_10150 [Cellvibrio zantedeschiae]